MERTAHCFLILILLAVLVCCHEKSANKKSIDKTESVQKTKPPSSFQDTLSIDKTSAVYFEPDSIQLEQLKSISEKNSFETNVHETFYQLRNTKAFLQQHLPRVKIISAKNFRWLVFKNDGKLVELIDLDKIADAWGMYFFEPGKNPRLIDMMSIDTEAPNYFSK
jgi:hypothetical protein